MHAGIYSSLILIFLTPPSHPSLVDFSEAQIQLDPLYLPHLLSPATSNAFFPLGCLPRRRYQPLPPSLQCLGVKYAGLKIFIHFIQTIKKKNIYIYNEFYDLESLRTDSLGCPILPEHIVCLTQVRQTFVLHAGSRVSG